MATVTPYQLTEKNCDFFSSGIPQLDKVNGTNFPVSGLLFDAAADEWAYWKFRVAQYGSGNWTIDIDWEAVNATTGNVVWQATLAAITPNTDSQDVETKAFATLNYVQDTHLGTTGKRVHRCSITLSNLDSVADGDWVVLAIGRDGNGTNATDDMSNDAKLLMATVSYSNT